MDSWIESTLSKFINGNKLCGAAGTLEGTDAIQSDIDRLERRACVNLMFNKAEYKVLAIPRTGQLQEQIQAEWKIA